MWAGNNRHSAGWSGTPLLTNRSSPSVNPATRYANAVRTYQTLSVDTLATPEPGPSVGYKGQARHPLQDGR